jgi:pyroglutamyl-peptidase
MATTILLTGFGPFPGAPFNPTEPLVEELACRRYPAFGNVRRLAHIFHVSYETVDRELPALLERAKPDALIMFGLATRSRHLRIEMRARNTLIRGLPDAAGRVPASAMITEGAPVDLPLPAPAHRLLMAARAAGIPAERSRNAGGYLCNYLCWRAAEAAKAGTPRLATFVHVPSVHQAGVLRAPRTSLTFDDLVRAGDAILKATVAAVRAAR